MSRLQALIQKIDNIATPADAAREVEAWLPHAKEQLTGFMGASEGTKNCSLMAEWTATCYKVGVVSPWLSVMTKPALSTLNGGNRKLPFDKSEVLYLANNSTKAGSHELIVIRDGTSYGLFHAWDGKFELFPRLNGGRNYNVSGTGDAGLEEILKKLTGGWTIMDGCSMGTEWKVIAVD
jgi:hypothetical protein